MFNTLFVTWLHAPHGLGLGFWLHNPHLHHLPVPRWPVRPPVPGTFCTPGGVCTG